METEYVLPAFQDGGRLQREYSVLAQQNYVKQAFHRKTLICVTFLR